MCKEKVPIHNGIKVDIRGLNMVKTLILKDIKKDIMEISLIMVFKEVLDL